MIYKRLANWILLLILAVFLIGTVLYGQSLKASVKIGNPVPDFELQTSEGTTVRLSQFRGRVVFLNFWAGWCDPCREETPALQTFHQRYGDRVVQLGVNWREPLAVIETYRRLFHLTYPSLRDADGLVARQFSMRAVPETWFIDESGVARTHHVGVMSFEQMQQAAEQVLGRSLDADVHHPLEPGDVLHDLAADEDGALWAATSRGLFRLNASGDWQPASLHRGDTVSIRQLGAYGSRLWALDEQGGIWLRSEEGWSKDQQLPVADAEVLLLDPSGSWIWDDAQGFWHAPGLGSAWSRIEADLPAEVSIHDLLLVPADGRQALLAGTSQGVWRSLDGGHHWTPLDLQAASFDPEGKIPWDPRFRRPVHRLSVDVRDNDTIYLATEIGVWLSRDGGQTFHHPLGSPFRKLSGVASTPDGRVILAAPNGDIYSGTPEKGWSYWNDGQEAAIR